MIIRTINLAALVFIGLYSTNSLASYASAQTKQLEEANNTPDKVEHIEVFGSKPLSFYKYQHRKSQRTYIKEFNALVDEGEYKIRCYKRSNGIKASRIVVTKCAPRYEEDLKADVFIFGVSNPSRDRQYIERVKAKSKEHLEITAKLLNANPELKETFLKMDAARVTLENKKKQKVEERKRRRAEKRERRRQRADS
jgi:hypothetical protein